MKQKKGKKGKAGKKKTLTPKDVALWTVKPGTPDFKVSWATLVDLVCPKCKYEVKAEMRQDRMGIELICKECFAVALKKVPKLKPKNLSDKIFVETFSKTKPK